MSSVDAQDSSDESGVNDRKPQQGYSELYNQHPLLENLPTRGAMIEFSKSERRRKEKIKNRKDYMARKLRPYHEKDREMIPLAKRREGRVEYQYGLPGIATQVAAHQIHAPSNLRPELDVGHGLPFQMEEIDVDHLVAEPKQYLTLTKLIEEMETETGEVFEDLAIMSRTRDPKKRICSFAAVMSSVVDSISAVDIEDAVVMPLTDIHKFKEDCIAVVEENYHDAFKAHYTKLASGKIQHLEDRLQILENRNAVLSAKNLRYVAELKHYKNAKTPSSTSLSHFANEHNTDFHPETLFVTQASQLPQAHHRQTYSQPPGYHRSDFRNNSARRESHLSRSSAMPPSDEESDTSAAPRSHTQKRKLRQSDQAYARGPWRTSNGNLGTFVREDEVGPIFDYSNLMPENEGDRVRMGGKDDQSDRSLEYEDTETVTRGNHQNKNNTVDKTNSNKALNNFTPPHAGTLARRAAILHGEEEDGDDDEIGPIIPVGWGRTPVIASTEDTDTKSSSRSLGWSDKARSWIPKQLPLPVSRLKFNWTKSNVPSQRPPAIWTVKDQADGMDIANIDRQGPKSLQTPADETVEKQSFQAVFGENHFLAATEKWHSGLMHQKFVSDAELYKGSADSSEFGMRNSTIMPTTGEMVPPRPGNQFIPKFDSRLSNLTKRGDTADGSQGPIKKRLKKEYRASLRERDAEIETATQLFEQYMTLSPDERQQALKKLRAPIVYWEGVAGAAVADIVEVDKLPSRYHQRFHTVPIQNRPQVNDDVSNDTGSMFVESDDGNAHPFFENLGYLDIPSRPLGGRNEAQSERLLRDLVRMSHPQTRGQTTQSFSPSRNSSTCKHPRITTGRSDANTSGPSSRYGGTPEYAAFLRSLDDSPELALVPDIDFCNRTQSAQSSRNLRQATLNCEAFGRVVQVQLHALVKLTPGAIMSRVFGGIVQEIQLHPRLRIALVIFLHPMEARAFVKHCRAVRNNGNDHERRELQVEVDWYKGREIESLLKVSTNTMIEHIATGCTRLLRLNRIALTTKKEDLAKDLAFYLGKLLIKVILVAPREQYKQELYGKQALVEFASIRDAVEAKRAIEEGMISVFANSEPEYDHDPCEEPQKLKSYCSCMGCKELKMQRETMTKAS